ncbi:MAG: OadG family protein [gamma proteobacterium symbiont of Bathyaustriella thionipta]|nr:OadG family protein [gamma proteobacterium symbiont of Bathyaustriella thionipta]
MPVSDLLLQGVQLMAIGMGIVFSFLLLLVGVLVLVRAIGGYFAAEPVDAATFASGANSASEHKLIAVISAAIGQHRAQP